MAPQSMADFPAREQAAYFTEFIKMRNNEEKAKLAEEAGFGVSPFPACLIKKETLTESDNPRDRKIILPFKGKPVGY